jgi:predicted DNA-binding ribbon-helix-helix protein
VKSMILKRSIALAGHKTSVSLEEAFWRALKDIAASQRMTLSDLICGIDTKREYGNLSSALRLFVLGHYQARSSGLEHAPSRRAEIERVPNGANCNSA